MVGKRENADGINNKPGATAAPLETKSVVLPIDRRYTAADVPDILTYILPYLKAGARYAARIQSAIGRQPSKEESDNPFAAALSDADLSIQTMVEVALLSRFPGLRFHGEEHAVSHNTKYFPGIDFGAPGELLALLDPIDGTRLYVDQHSGYQILFSLATREAYEAVLALTPRHDRYMYSIRGHGTFVGSFSEDLGECSRVQLTGEGSREIFLGLNASLPHEKFPEYRLFDVLADYRVDQETLNMSAMLEGHYAAVVLESGQLIDNVPLMVMAQEGGAYVTLFDGSPLPPPGMAVNMRIGKIICAASAPLHERLVAVLKEKMR